jgi:outer membrane protein assembly factor BamB
VTAVSDGGASYHVVAFDRASGRLLWDTEVFRQAPGAKDETASSAATPAADGQRVYAVFPGGVAAVTFRGEIAWTNRDHPFHVCGASPILYQDMLIFGDGSSVLALDKSCGRERWRAGRGPSRVALATPLVITSYGGDQLISAVGDGVQGSDPLTGQRFWSLTSPSEGAVTSVVVGGGLVLVASDFGQPTLRAVRGGGRDGSPAQVVWEVRQAVPRASSPLYLDGRLYTVTESGVAQCLDAQTGRALWQERLPGSYTASPVATGGRVYFLNDAGECVVVAAADTFRVLARNPLNEPCRDSMAGADGHWFIRTKDHLYCIGPSAGGH